MMTAQEMLYEGKAKKVYKTDQADVYRIAYKDDATAFNALKRGTIAGKGEVNNRMSAFWFALLEKEGVPTHFVELLSKTEMTVKAVEIVPVEVIVRNIAAGSMAKRMGLPEGKVLPFPTIEFSYKSDALGDPLINDDYALALELATKEELATMREYALKINALMKEKLDSIGITLVDFKIEFGRYKGKIILADEISPDTCRFWDKETGKKLDKDRFRLDLGDVEESYQEIFARITGGEK